MKGIFLPERHCQDLLHIDPPLQHLRHLPFLWSLFHLFSSNQVHRLWGQDQVPLNPLNTAEKKQKKQKNVNLKCFVSCFRNRRQTEGHRPWSGGHISWLCLRSRSSLSCPGTVGAQACHPYPGSHLQSFCWDCVAASPSGSTAGQKLDEPREREWGTETETDGQIKLWRCYFSHLLPSSGHTSCGPRISSRLSGWSWRSCQTCAP